MPEFVAGRLYLTLEEVAVEVVWFGRIAEPEILEDLGIKWWHAEARTLVAVLKETKGGFSSKYNGQHLL